MTLSRRRQVRALQFWSAERHRHGCVDAVTQSRRRRRVRALQCCEAMLWCRRMLHAPHALPLLHMLHMLRMLRRVHAVCPARSGADRPVWQEPVLNPVRVLCVRAGSTRSVLLDQELTAQFGRNGEAAISILPTIRINHVQYRGSLDKDGGLGLVFILNFASTRDHVVPIHSRCELWYVQISPSRLPARPCAPRTAGVTRAVCASFPHGAEPDVCTEGWVSEKECDAGDEGYKQCRVG